MAMVQSRNLVYRVWAARLVMVFMICLVMFPFLMIISVSFRSGNFATGSLIPENPSLEHWAMVLGIPYTMADGSVVNPTFPVMTWLWSSIKVSAIASGLILLLSTTGAYAFARLRFRFKNNLLTSMMILQMFPAVLALVAIHAFFNRLGDAVPWLGPNTHSALIMSYLGGITMHIWLIKGYFESIDKALEESASIDGATPWQAFYHILLPLSVPILAVVFVLSFIGVIGEYPVASILLQSVDQQTLAVGIKQFLYAQNYLWGDFAAAAVLTGMPITIVFLMAQRYLVSGLTAGGVKG